jgi:hypothetical protein
MRQHDRPAMARQRRLISDARVLDLLDSPAYADVRAALIASGVFAADGWGETFIQLMMDRYDALRGHKDPPIEATIGRQMLGAKHAVLVRAEELLQNPELGRRYAATLGPGANVTLVVYAPGWNGTALASQMREVVPELTSEPGPDVLLLALPHPDDDAVSARCSALVTNDPVPAGLSRLERFTASDLVALRDRLQ